jgi:hypothetical protein
VVLLFYFFGALPLLCVVEMRGMWPPFIGGDEGVLGNMLDPHIEVAKRLLSIDYADIPT